MTRFTLPGTLLTTVLLAAACSDSSTPLQPSEALFAKPGGGGTSTAVHHWKFPVADGHLGLRSDGAVKYVSGDGKYNVYKHGVCGVSASFQAGGDATMQTNNPNYRDRKCAEYPRKVKIVYLDPNDSKAGEEEPAMEAFFNLNNARDILLDETVERPLNLNPTQTTRCDAWRWREFDGAGNFIGGNSVLVTRLNSSTLHVRTKPYPENKAICTTTGEPHYLTVDLLIVVE